MRFSYPDGFKNDQIKNKIKQKIEIAWPSP